MVIGVIIPTKGRHSLLEQVLGCMINQDYRGPIHILLYNNSRSIQQLGDFQLPLHISIQLINNYINPETGLPFTALGQIYRHAIQLLPEGIDLVTFTDDDDLYLPNHISQAAERIGDNTAFKPYYSWFRTPKGMTKAHNVHEPSIFVRPAHVLEYGFRDGADCHHQWIAPLGHFDDPGATPTFIYQWMGNNHQFSGNPDHPQNFINHEKALSDEGDGIIHPTHVTYPDLPL
jgi:hypothetical protein